jgi:LAO/AO transport system kinase
MTLLGSSLRARSDVVEPLALAKRVLAGDVRAVSRLITLLENQESDGVAVLQQLESVVRCAVTIGVTGYPGAGKSTLIDQLATAYRRQGKKVGILAVDTSSPLTGGAILGDRIRMQDHSLDPGVYIRSMATRGQHGGLARATREAVRVLEAAGYEVILVETVGVGQAEVDIAKVAQTVVAVVAPGLGDEVQAMKAGLLEVAHIVVVNKGDRENADMTMRDLREWVDKVIRTVAVKGEGIPELIEAIAEHQRIVDLQHKPHS